MNRPEVGDRAGAAPRSSVRERRSPTALFLAGVLLAAWAAVVWQTGGFGVDVSWGRVSSRDPLRPLVASALCFLLLAWRTGVPGLAAAARGTTAVLESIAPAAAALAAIVVGWLGIAYGAHVAGGADPYGYVSQAELWLRGTLVVDFSSLGPLPWRRPEWTLSPLGYRPGLTPYTIVPTYSPGLPMLMALAQAGFGDAAKYLVVPLSAAAAVWLTFLLGSRLSDRLAGLIAAGLLAASPTFLYQTMWPMSDVPAAAFWTLAIVCACTAGRMMPLAAGLAAAVAVLIRPNLVPLAVVPGLLIVAGAMPEALRARAARGSLYAAGVLPGVVAVAVLNTYWYGSPGQSGYGSVGRLYQLAHFWPNVQRYTRWLIETQGPIVLLALLPLVTARLGPAERAIRRPFVRVAAALFVTVIALLYFFYLVFEEWWYLRFFLPAFPLLLVLTAVGLRDVLHRIHPAMAPAAVVIAAPLVAWMAQGAASRAVFGVQQQERGYLTVARDVSRDVPPDGVVFAMQHSGSLRYYANRLTLRYDQLRQDDLDLAIEALAARGRRVYLLVEEWEVRAFVERFGAHSCRGRLDWGYSRTGEGVRTSRLYDLAPQRCGETAPAKARGKGRGR